MERNVKVKFSTIMVYDLSCTSTRTVIFIFLNFWRSNQNQTLEVEGFLV